MYSGTPRTASLVVPTRNGLPLLRYTLESLAHQDALTAAYEVVVVDDASEDGTSAWLSAYRPPHRLTILRNERCRLGRGVTRNRGIDAASGDIVVFVDGDMICPPTLVTAHLRLHADGETHGAENCVTGYPWFWRSVATWSFGEQGEPLLDPALIARWEEFERWAGGPLADPETPVAVARQDSAPFVWSITRALSVRRSVAVELGGFDERFRGYGWEDFEFGYRLALRGTRFLAHPAAAAFHQQHPVSAGNDAEFDRNYGIFLDLHPDFEVALLTVCPSTTDGRYPHLCGAYRQTLRVAPALAEAVEEVFVDYARARQRRQPNPLRGWAFWAERWGAERCRRLQSEQLIVIGDIHGRRLTSMFRDLTGFPEGDWGGRAVGRLPKNPLVAGTGIVRNRRVPGRPTQ